MQEDPGVELGFYDRNLDIILDGDENSYGENFSKWRKAAFEKTIGTGEPVFQNLGVSGGGRLEMYRPLVRDGQVIGAVWATESLTGFYRRLDQVQLDAYLAILELDQGCQGRHLTEVFPADSPFSANLFKALREGVLVKDLEIDHPVNGRGRRQFLISTSLLRNARQEVMGAVLTCRDITERVQMEEQIRRQERLAALGKLVAGVAHEIRNPITAISGYTQFWQKDHPPSPRSLAIIHREITRLNNIVDRLLYFARPVQAVFGAHDLNARLDGN